MSDRFERSLRNLAIALFVLPLRAPLLLVLFLVCQIGKMADSMGRFIARTLPGLRVDQAWIQGNDERLRRHHARVEAYKGSKGKQ